MNLPIFKEALSQRSSISAANSSHYPRKEQSPISQITKWTNLGLVLSPLSAKKGVAAREVPA